MSDLLPLIWLPGISMLDVDGLSAFFSASETALFYLSADDLRAMRDGSAGERAAAGLMAVPARVLTAVNFWNLLVNMTYFAASLVAAGNLAEADEEAAAGAVGVVAVAFIILFGEVVPKSVAVVFRRRLAVLVAWPLAASVRAVDPIAPPLAALTVSLRRAFWPGLGPEPLLDAADLERAVEASSQSREVVAKERQVLHNALDLSEIRLEEAMRPRGSYRVLAPPVHRTDLRGPVPPGGFVALREPDGHDVDRVLPLADLSDFPERNIETKAVDLVHLPWSATLADALQFVRARNVPAVSVVNEHGETIGLITRDDLLDALLMPEADRAKRMWRRDPVAEVSPGVYHVEGITTLRHLAGRLGLEHEPDEDGNVTVAGLLLEEFEQLPEPGSTAKWRGYRVTVLDVSDRGVRRVLVEKVPPTDDGEPPQPDA